MTGEDYPPLHEGCIGDMCSVCNRAMGIEYSEASPVALAKNRRQRECLEACSGVRFIGPSERIVREIIEAARTGARWMEWWPSQIECECDGVHICGLPDRQAELSQMKAALSRVQIESDLLSKETE